MKSNPEIWELNGDYYQVIGHAWDHEVKDFKVVYRPLYHCTAKPDRFEAHYMAVSHFSRWEEKFRKVPEEEMDKIPKANKPRNPCDFSVCSELYARKKQLENGRQDFEESKRTRLAVSVGPGIGVCA